MDSKFAHYPYELKALFKSTLDTNNSSRGSVNSFVENGFFQDPLIKTIKYLETIEQKEHHNVVQFLTGLSRILDKFDKRSCIRKIIPLMLKCIHKGDLSVLILPAVINIVKKKDYLDKEAFQEFVWPHISSFCEAGEMPAQALFILVENSELFSGFINAGDFQSVFLPLILKSLECGVQKLQHLGINKIPFLSKKIEYTTFKNQIMPRLLMLLTENTVPLKIKEVGCEVLIGVLSILDKNFLRDNILKALQILREKINEPVICMHLLTLYSGIAGALTPEDIGNKILPGLIPMLISASFTKPQFNKLISTIRTLIDELEKHRLKDLSEMDPLDQVSNDKSGEGNMFAGIKGNFDDPTSALPSTQGEGEFDFLSIIEGTNNKQGPKSSAVNTANIKPVDDNPFPNIGGSSFPSQPKKSDNSNLFKGLGQPPPNAKPAQRIENMSMPKKSQPLNFDPFDTSGPSKPNNSSTGMKNDIFSGMDPFGTNKPSNSDPFSNFGSSNPVQEATGIITPSINMTSGFKSLNDGSDPFADILKEEKKQEPSGFGGFDSGINLSSGFGGQSQQKPPTQKQSAYGKSNDNPFSGLGGPSKPATQNKPNTGYGGSSSGNNYGSSSSVNKQSNFGGSSYSSANKPSTSQATSSIGASNNNFSGGSGNHL